MTVLSATLLILLVLDPVGNIPFFVTALQRVPPERRRWVMVRELLIALAALVVFLFAGSRMLALLRIEQPSLSIAGGIILFLIALRMTFPDGEARRDADFEGEPFVVPLAIPFVAGPSALATVLLIMNQEPQRWPEWLIAVVSGWAVTGAVLFVAEPLGRMLGRRGMIAVERLMGMILTAIAVQMTMDGLRKFLSNIA